MLVYNLQCAVDCVLWYILSSRHNWRRCPWKARESGLMLPLAKMRVPLSISHPVIISILIHNR